MLEMTDQPHQDYRFLLASLLAEEMAQEARRKAQPVDPAELAAARRIALGRSMVPIIFDDDGPAIDVPQVPAGLGVLTLPAEGQGSEYSFERFILDLADF
jgi:hypothetical protein